MKPYQRQDFICELTGITPNAKLVLFVLSRHAKDDSMTCWLSQARLKKLTGIKSDDGIDAAVRNLEARGVLTVTRPRKYPGRGHSNVYTLHFDAEVIPSEAGYSTEANTPKGLPTYPEGTPEIPRNGGPNTPPRGDQPLNHVNHKNQGATALALEARAPRRSRPPAPNESPEEKRRRQWLDVADLLRITQRPSETDAAFIARVQTAKAEHDRRIGLQ